MTRVMEVSEQSDIPVPLGAAVLALNDRKMAVVPVDDEVSIDSDEARMMTLGFDLSPRELLKLGAHVGRYTAGRIDDVERAAESAWMDGVLTGLMLAELRSRRS